MLPVGRGLMKTADKVTTAREALTAELLGDVAELMDRVEGLKSEIGTVAEAACRDIAAAAERAAGMVAEGAGKSALSVSNERRTWLTAAQQVNQEIKSTAAAITGQAHRLYLTVLALGVVGGVAGGVLAGLALGRWLG